MAQNVIIIGAGIIGASAAYQLQKAGASVTVLDAGRASATAASFGWINASFFLNADHFALRVEAIAAYRALTAELDLAVNWCGCLCFENTGAALDAQARELRALGYEFEEIDASAFAALTPDVANPPARALMFPGEAAAEPGALTDGLLSAATQMGARVIRGAAVTGFETRSDAVCGVHTSGGIMAADQVICAAGTATETLLGTLDIPLPMLDRPAVMVHTPPVRRMMNHILVSEMGEIRQLPDGSLMFPAAVGHQQDQSATLAASAEQEADAALARLQAMLPGVPLRWDRVTLAHRPMPADQLPVIGSAMDGLYVACMHSGITLGALAGAQIATEVTAGPTNDTARRLAPYRPERFRA